MHKVVDIANEMIFAQASKSFPKQWTQLTPQLVTVASWVGYDLDGRRDIQWSDTIRIKLERKPISSKIIVTWRSHYRSTTSPERSGRFYRRAGNAIEIAREEKFAFAQDLNIPENLMAAAELLTTSRAGRWVDISRDWLISMLPSVRQKTAKQSKLIWFFVRI